MNKALLFPINLPPYFLTPTLRSLFDTLLILPPSRKSLKQIEETTGERGWIEALQAPWLEEADEEFDDMVKAWRQWAGEIGLGAGTNSQLLLNATASRSETVGSILDELKGIKKSNPILEARLTLQLALDYDLEQYKLDEEMCRLAQKEDSLRRIVGPDKGEEEGELLPDSMAPSFTPVPQIEKIAERCRAWSMCWRACERGVPGLLLGVGLDTKDIVDKRYERLARGRSQGLPVELLDLTMPLEKEKANRAGALLGGLLSGPLMATSRLKEQGGDRKAACEEITETWPFKGEQIGPRLLLTIYEGVDIDTLLGGNHAEATAGPTPIIFLC